MNSSAKATLGTVQHPKKDWLTCETLDLIDQKRAARLAGNTAQYKRLTTSCKDRVQRDKQKWADTIASLSELQLQTGQIKDAFSNFRLLRSAGPRISSPILSGDGSMVSEKHDKLRRSKDLLNRPPASPSDELASAAAEAVPDPTIDCSPPTEEEVMMAVSHLKNSKAPGLCNLPAEVLKNTGPGGVKWLTSIFQSVWQSGTIPEDWHKGIILPFYKGKGSKHDCRNYRGITLLSVPGKAFARILLTGVKDTLVQSRRIQQSGFTRGRSTVDRIATLNMLHQTRREFGQPLWAAYVDLKVAFNSVDRNAL